MKIINLHTKLEKLIAKAKQNDRRAQHEIYKRFAPKLLSLARLYIADVQFAEDVLSRSFVKIFNKIHQFTSNEKAFPAWCRQILVHEAIDFLRRQKAIEFPSHQLEHLAISTDDEALSYTQIDQIQSCIDQLPNGYKLVFNLYVVESYTHKAIAETLGISVGTSKSQLSKAKKMIMNLLHNQKQLNG